MCGQMLVCVSYVWMDASMSLVWSAYESRHEYIHIHMQLKQIVCVCACKLEKSATPARGQKDGPPPWYLARSKRSFASLAHLERERERQRERVCVCVNCVEIIRDESRIGT